MTAPQLPGRFANVAACEQGSGLRGPAHALKASATKSYIQPNPPASTKSAHTVPASGFSHATQNHFSSSLPVMPASQTSASAAVPSKPSNVVCDGDACFVVPAQAAPAATATPAADASALTALLGDTLLSAEGEVPTATIAGPGKVVGLYFSAHWCPPCRGFTPELVSIYRQFKAGHARAADWSIVFVSSDEEEAAFRDYFAEMPWLALPYQHRDREADLSAKFGVSGIPTLLLLDGATGEVITADGRHAVCQDPECIDFPWKPQPLSQLLQGSELVNKEGQTFKAEEVLAGKVRMVYFSAHWCPPCRRFTPLLAQRYQALKAAGKAFEVVFVSSDRDEASFEEYLGEMPWLALSFADRERKAQLCSAFQEDGIPTLLVVDENDVVLNLDAAEAVAQDTDGAAFPYRN